MLESITLLLKVVFMVFIYPKYESGNQVHDLFAKTHRSNAHVCRISTAHCTLTNQQTVPCLVMLHIFHTYFTIDKA
jgi:hypothetical protein